MPELSVEPHVWVLMGVADEDEGAGVISIHATEQGANEALAEQEKQRVNLGTTWEVDMWLELYVEQWAVLR